MTHSYDAGRKRGFQKDVSGPAQAARGSVGGKSRRPAAISLLHACERLARAIESTNKALREHAATLQAPHLKASADYIAAARADCTRAALAINEPNADSAGRA